MGYKFWGYVLFSLMCLSLHENMKNFIRRMLRIWWEQGHSRGPSFDYDMSHWVWVGQLGLLGCAVWSVRGSSTSSKVHSHPESSQEKRRLGSEMTICFSWWKLCGGVRETGWNFGFHCFSLGLYWRWAVALALWLCWGGGRTDALSSRGKFGALNKHFWQRKSGILEVAGVLGGFLFCQLS